MLCSDVSANAALYYPTGAPYSIPSLYIGIWGLYYKTTLRTRNLRQMERLRSKLVSLLLAVTNALTLTNTLAYYGIRKL
jgi:hypothetical protein